MADFNPPLAHPDFAFKIGEATPRPASPQRLRFIDNLRYAIVLAVVAFHASVGYFEQGWWYVRGDDPHVAFALIAFLVDAFAMSALFFFAGYFALPALRKRGLGQFLGSKFLRLGIPWLIGVTLLLPVMPYLHIIVHVDDNASYWTFWSNYLGSMTDGEIVVRDPIRATDATRFVYGFTHHHLWFIALLLTFFVVWAVAREILYNFVPSLRRSPPAEQATSREMLWDFIGIGFAFTFMQAGFNFIVGDAIWVDLANLYLLQIARLPLYIGVFGLGILACSRGWFQPAGLAGPLWLWGLLTVFTSAAVMLTAKLCADMPDDAINTLEGRILNAGQGAARAVAAFAWIGLLCAYAQRYWNESSGFDRELAASSYDIYLLHLPIVVVLQYWLISAPIANIVKFLLVCMVATGASYAISRWIVRPVYWSR